MTDKRYPNPGFVQLPVSLQTERLGSVTLTPDKPITAGMTGTWTLTLTVGSYGIDEGGTIKIAQRLANDWEAPQFDRPQARGYCTVWTDGNAVLKPGFYKKSHVRPWSTCIVIDVTDGSLSPGDTVRIVLGDPAQGSPGIRAQTFVESAHTLQVMVDPTNSCLVHPLPDSPTLPILADQPVSIFAVAPSVVTSGKTATLHFRGQDRWGNPALLTDPVTLAWQGTGNITCDSEGNFQANSLGAGQFQIRSGALLGWSNPIIIADSLPRLRPFWGDLHAQSDSTVGTGSEEEYFLFGREQAFLDFIGHQGNDFQLTTEDWKRLNDTVNQFHQEGRYVIIPGYEWSGNTPSGGDRNVFFLESNPPIFRSSHWLVSDEPENEQSPAHPADVLFERVKAHGNAFTCAHVGGRYADIRRYFDQDVCPLVELVSCWGIFEWLLQEALDCHYVVGVMANSDGHKGRPGAEGPGAGKFGIHGGLTCVLAPELTREAIFHALQNRCCYGTTGPRIHIDFEVAGHPMGWKGKAPPDAMLKARVHGAAPFEKLELFCQSKCVQTVWHPAFDSLTSSRHLRVLWKGAHHRGRGRRVTWNGKITVEGACIQNARTVAFDSPEDGLTHQDPHSLCFTSHTTGDTDGVEIELDQHSFTSLTLETPEGTWTVSGDDPALGNPDGVYRDLGPLEKSVRIQYYPQPDAFSNLPLSLEAPVYPRPDQPHTAWYLKATQTDGHLAWTSPVYLEG